MTVPNKGISVRHVLTVVSRHFGVTDREVLSQQRSQRVAWPRHVTVGLAARLTPYSLSHIGRAMGGRDPTTARNSLQQFKSRLGIDPDAAAQVAAIEHEIVQQAGKQTLAAELTFTEGEIEARRAELAQIDAMIDLAERRFAAVRRSFELVAAARAVARARTAVIIAEHTYGESIARRELESRVDALMRVAEGGHV